MEKANLNYILRDHDADNIARRQEIMKEIAKKLNEKYGAGTVNLTLKEEYRNMAEKIRENFHLIENAKKAVKKSGVEPQVVPVRGGTDGARLSFMVSRPFSFSSRSCSSTASRLSARVKSRYCKKIW